MSKKERQIDVSIVADPTDSDLQLVQIKGETVGTIKKVGEKFEIHVGDDAFSARTEKEAVKTVVSEYHLHEG